MEPTLLHQLHLILLAQTPEEAPAADPSILDMVLPWTKWLALAVVLIVAVLVIRRILSSAGDGGAALKGGGFDRNTKRLIQERVRGGDFAAAGDIAFQHQAFDQAAELYLQGNHFALAAEAYASGGKRTQAIQFFKRAKLPQRAAELYEQAGQTRAAANEYVACGDHERAAKLFFKANEFRRAGETFQQLRRWKEAGESFERLGLKPEASEMYEKFFTEEYEIARGMAETIPEATQKGRYAASFFRSNGEHERAARLFERTGDLGLAAQSLGEAGNLEAAAKLYLRAKQPEQAARLFEEAGDAEKAAECYGEALLLRGDIDGAAAEFARGRKFLRAAEVLQEAGQRLRAAEMFTKAGDFRLAAELFALEDRLDLAAKGFEKAGDFDRASQLYRRLNDRDGELRAVTQARDHFRLGQLYVEMNRPEDALAALQRLDTLSDRFEQACEMQGDILRKMGRFDVAMSKYRAATGDREPSPGNLAPFYKLALCAQETGQLAVALQYLERVLGVDFYYEDVQERINALRARLGSPAPSGPRGVSAPPPRVSGSLRSLPGGLHPSGAMPALSGAMPALQPARYEIIDEIARGGMGVVYRARDTVLNRVVAFKILSDSLKGNSVAVEYFLREARAAAALQHPNILTVYDAGEQSGEYYMAMEYVDGKTLKGLVAEQGPFHEKLIRFVLISGCKGLSYAHAQGIVHRDIKSGNIMIARDRTLKIMDFGLAKFVQEYQSNHTKAIGTPFYMSPEQILGHNLDHRSDLYSLGVTLFECATGTVPFYKGEMAYHHLHTPPPQPRSLNPKLSAGMEEIILRLLAKDPNDRYQSAEEVARALKVAG